MTYARSIYHAAHSNNIDRDVLVSTAPSQPFLLNLHLHSDHQYPRPPSPDLRHQNLHPLRHRKIEYELWKVITKISGRLFTFDIPLVTFGRCMADTILQLTQTFARYQCNFS